MNITYHDKAVPVSPYPGLTRLLTMDRQFGSGAITQGMVTIDPGMLVRPHTHLVEESITLLEGDVRVLVGSETVEVRGRRATFLAPANVVHGLRSIGSTPAVICIAYPSVQVAVMMAEGVEI